MQDHPKSGPGTGKSSIFRHSIRIKLIIAFLTLAIVPTSIIAYYNLAISRGEIEETAEEELLGLSRSAAYHIEQLLIENQRTSATLAGEPIVVQFLAASEKERPALAPQIYQTLENFAATHPDFDAPGLLDVNGIVLASPEEILVGTDRSFRDYFQASIKGQAYISDILVGRATGRPGVFLTNPVVTAEGDIVGIDIVWLKADSIRDIIDNVVVGEEGIAYLVDQDGVIVAHPNSDLLYHSLGELTQEAVATIADTIRFGVIAGTESPLIPESLGMDDLGVELASATGSSAFRYLSPLDQRYHVIGYTPLEEHPWIVVVDLPEAQFLAPMQRLENITWISIGILAVVALAVSILLALSITRPLRRLTEAASAVEQGRSFEPADIEDVTAGQDEIAYLGRVFSSMVLGLRQELARRKQAEEENEHLNLVLRAIRNINQLIIREQDRHRLLQGACDILTETRGYHNAWIALLDKNGALVTTAEANLGDDFLKIVERFKTGDMVVCAEKALSQPGVLYIDDSASTCVDCPLMDKYGDRGALIVRLEHGGKVYGLMAISISNDLIISAEERELFEEAAGDIAFALYSIGLDEKRVRAEEALQEREEKHRLLSENSLDCIWKMDLNLEFTYINPAVFDMLGYSPEEWVGSKLAEHCSPEGMQKTASIITNELENLETHTGVLFETSFFTKQGKEINCEVNGKIVIDETGKPTGFQGSTRDITLRKQAEEALQEHSERLEELVEERSAELKTSEAKARAQYKGIPVPTYTWQKVEDDIVLVDFNDAALEITQGGIVDFMGARVSDVYRGKPQIQQEIERCFTEKTNIEREMQYEYLSTGERKHLAVIYAFVSPDLVIVHTEDITDRVEAQERLVRSEKLAALGQIAGSIAHELRNPLGVISNAAYFLKTLLSDGDEKVMEYTDILTEEVINASRIIESLLDISRTTSVDKTATSFRSIVSQINEVHAPPGEIQLNVRIPDDLPDVLVDANQVEMVIRNLLLNSYDAMPEGGELRIEALPGEGEIIVSVSDTGCGIPEENIEKIFEPLFTTKERGIGLGLSISKQLIDASGGKIDVESKMGKGTVFTFSLPQA